MDEQQVQDPHVEVKPEAVKVTKGDKETPEQRMERLNMSHMPYHTAETEKIAEGNAKQLADRKVEYKYEANGYTVKEIDPVPPQVPGENGKLYEVTADDFKKVFNTKRAAETYAETHAEAHKDQPATISKA